MTNPANTTAYRGQDGRLWVDVTETKTLAIADVGYVQNVIFDSASVAQINIPATATLGYWVIRAGGVAVTSGPTGTKSNHSMRLAISPVAADQLQGDVGGAAVDNKDLILSKAKMRVGDEIAISNVAQTDGPLIAYVKVGDPTGLSREA